jgi:hypothetical protein
MFRSYGTVYAILALLVILWAAIIALGYEIGKAL